jgi:hypothetical protein
MKKLCLVFVMSILLISCVSALEKGTCANFEVTDISPSSIKVGDEFTVGIAIDNCGSLPATDIKLELVNPSDKILINEPLVIEIGDMYYANSDRFLTYHMRVSDDAEPGIYNLKTRMSYKTSQATALVESNITINVIGDRAELSIASLKTSPVLPRKGETVELTMRIENTGDGTAKSVEVYVDHPFQGLKQSFIGSLKSDEDGPAILTFIVDEDGDFEFPVTISYKDDFGTNEINTNVNLSVLKKQTNFGAIFFVLFLIAVIVAGVYYSSKTKKEKDKIIHQLLSGEIAEKNEEVKHHKKKVVVKVNRKEAEKKVKRRKEFKQEMLRKYRK